MRTRLFLPVFAILPAVVSLAQDRSQSNPYLIAGIDGTWQDARAIPTSVRGPKRQEAIEGIARASVTIRGNPRDPNGYVSRAYYLMQLGDNLNYSFTLYPASRDLESAIRLDPQNFYAHHNYAQCAFQIGMDLFGYSTNKLAISEFTRALELKPSSAQSYMGRGWAYLQQGDEQKAQADFERTLQLDPSLRQKLETEANAIRVWKAQRAGIGGVINRMGRTQVVAARTAAECSGYRGVWNGSQCTVSMAMDPTPAPGEAYAPSTSDAKRNSHGTFMK